MENKITLKEQIENTTFQVMSEKFMVAKISDKNWLKENFDNINIFAFMVEKVNEQYTVIIQENESEIPEKINAHKNYRLIRFNLHVPFEGVGFIATVTKEVAKENINILAISSYSFDYIMVKDNDLSKTKKALENIGMKNI